MGTQYSMRPTNYTDKEEQDDGRTLLFKITSHNVSNYQTSLTGQCVCNNVCTDA